MADLKTTAPEVRACGDLLSMIAHSLNDIATLAEVAIEADGMLGREAALQGIKALVLRTGALADAGASALGQGPCAHLDDWAIGQEGLAVLAGIKGESA